MWYSISFNDGVEAFIPTGQIEQAFRRIFLTALGPIEMALFSRDEPDGKVTIYFSPAAASFAQSITGAHPCQPPAPEGLILLAGDEKCWKVLFPASS
jgi:hypothetical protein